jgi:hypothetical protein
MLAFCKSMVIVSVLVEQLNFFWLVCHLKLLLQLGGWTSLAFLLYWRRLKEILPMSTARAYRRSDIDRLSKILDDFRIRQNIPKSFLDSGR